MWQYLAGIAAFFLLFSKKDVVSAANAATGLTDLGDPSIPVSNTVSNNLARVRQWTPIVKEKLRNARYIKEVMGEQEILAFIYLESKGFTNLGNNAGEIGLMQVTPMAWQDLYDNGYAYDYSHNDLKYSAELQIRAGVDYLDLICRKIGTDVPDIVKSYNAGYGRILQQPDFAPAVTYLGWWNEKLGRLKGN